VLTLIACKRRFIFLVSLIICIAVIIESPSLQIASGNQDLLSLSTLDSLFIIENGFYKVELDSEVGGSVVGIYSKEGSGENLIQVITVSAEESFGWGRTFYQAFDQYAKIEVKHNDTNIIVIEVKAVLEYLYPGLSGIIVTNTLTFHRNLPFFTIQYNVNFQKNMTLFHLQVETITNKLSQFENAIIEINGSLNNSIKLHGGDDEFDYISRKGYVWIDIYNEVEGLGIIVPKAEDFIPSSIFSLWDDRNQEHKFLSKWEYMKLGPSHGIEVESGSKYHGEIIYVIYGKNFGITDLAASTIVGDFEGVLEKYTELQESYLNLEREYSYALNRIEKLEIQVEELTNELEKITADMYTFAQERLLLLLVLSLCISIVVVVFLGIF
jgi:hypothetical protein